MIRLAAILDALEEIAPSRFAFGFDHIGLQIGDIEAEVSRAVVSLDRSYAAAEYAARSKCQLLLSHHPLIWDPLASVTADTHVGRTIASLIRSGTSFAAAHTNWDCAKGGINDTLATLLDLRDVRAIGSAAISQRLKMVVFTPDDSTDAIVDAASCAGAGVIGLYRRCAFHHPGHGTFIGGEGANPVVGNAGRVEDVEEVRIEMSLPATFRDAVDASVRRVHPYEEPAIDYLVLKDAKEQAICRIGAVGVPCSLSDFSARIDAALATRSWIWGEPNRAIKTVAVCGGSAADEWRLAAAAGADILVTGEVPQHVALEASECGFALAAAGHYATEHPGCVALAEAMRVKTPTVEWDVFEPGPGSAGRPI